MDTWICEFFNIPEPPDQKVKIGARAEYCPECKSVLSFSDDRPFCRRCQKRIKQALNANGRE